MNDNYTREIEKIEVILNKNLPKIYSSEWKNAVFSSLPASISANYLSLLVNPCSELLALGGKRWRPILLVLVAKMILENSSTTIEEKINPYDFAPIVEFIHTASLIHDDIEDNADMRRGKPATYITHGVDTALNAATWLYFHSLSFVNELPISEALKSTVYSIVTTEIRRLHLGQAMDIAWHRENDFIPSESEYEAMVRLKTGTLACLSAKLGALSSFAPSQEIEDLGTIAADIGFGFQVLDDVLNLTHGNIGKKRGDDIVEGKKSLPVILHLKKNPSDRKKLVNYFLCAQKEGIESPAVEHSIALLESSNAINDAKKRAKKIIHAATQKIITQYPKGTSATQIENLFTKMLE
ncbi:MAG: polyprenyl synthetase family protein [Treponemataceae bacterium]